VGLSSTPHGVLCAPVCADHSNSSEDSRWHALHCTALHCMHACMRARDMQGRAPALLTNLSQALLMVRLCARSRWRWQHQLLRVLDIVGEG
jgi:hypothetical protein